MSETKNLRLFKHNEPLETNENKFDIDLALNQNWDKIEEFAGMVNDKVIELEDKDEEQDFNLQELQNEIKKDRENMINLETEGQSIHVEDSSDLEGKLEVLGNVEQDVREGYNILENTLTDGTVNGITIKVNKDKSISLNGTAEINMSIEISNKLINLENVDYTYYLKGKTANFNLFVTKENDETREIITKTDTNIKKVVNIGAVTIKNVKIYFQKGATANNVTVYPMIYKGTEEKPYEPYGASPSPEYPSTVRAVGDNINLWDKENMLVELGGYSGSNGNKYDSTTRIRNTKDIELKKGIYTLSAEDSKLISVYIVNLKKEISSNGDSATFTLEKDDTIRFTIENTALLNTKIKLERGNKKTSYSKFGQGSVEIKKTTANYYNVEDYNGNLNSHITIDENNWITASGKNTEESVTYLNHFTNNLDLIVGKKYWIVAEIKSVSGEGNFNITSASKGSGQFNGRAMQLTDLKIGQKVIFQETAINSAGQGLRTFISLQPGQTCNITFRLSVLETDPNKSNWKYVPYKKETYILPIQKPMLEGDYLDKVNKKEVHKFGYVNTKGMTDVKVLKSEILEENNFFRYVVTIPGITNKKLGTSSKIFCTHFVYGNSRWSKEEAICGWETGQQFCIGTFNKKYDTAEKLKTFLIENIVEIYYELAEPNKLNLTTEQTEILDELDNFQTYKTVTNISTDSIAKLRLKYIADTKTYVDNKTSNLEQQVSVINQLLSTTKTSSVLLDNLQSDIESEVL